MDSGGLLQRACAAAAGMGDVRLPHHLLHVFRLPRSPHHWPRRPYQHRLELHGKFQAGPSAIGCAWICTRHLFFSWLCLITSPRQRQPLLGERKSATGDYLLWLPVCQWALQRIQNKVLAQLGCVPAHLFTSSRVEWTVSVPLLREKWLQSFRAIKTKLTLIPRNGLVELAQVINLL